MIGDSHSAAQIKRINDFIKRYNKKAVIQEVTDFIRCSSTSEATRGRAKMLNC